MLRIENYFDHASTTQVDPRVVEFMLPWLRAEVGNPASAHSWGKRAEAAAERARAQVAELLGAEPGEVVFTSGASEGNNWIVRSLHPTISPFEHSSISEPAQETGLPMLGAKGWSVRDDGGTGPVSALAVSHETGAIIDVAHLTSRPIHSDISQAIGKVSFEIENLTWATFGSHKIGGPPGVGGVFARDGAFPTPFITGGGQEHGWRAGTIPTALIAGFGLAAELAGEKLSESQRHSSELGALVQNELHGLEFVDLSSPHNSPHILALAFPELHGEMLVLELDRLGYAVSAGPACSAGSNEPSKALLAAGFPLEVARGAVRVSFGTGNTLESAQGLARSLKRIVEQLRPFSPS